MALCFKFCFFCFCFFCFPLFVFFFVLFSVLLLEDFLNYAFLKDNNLSLFHIIYSLFIFCWCYGFHCFDIVVIFTTVVIVVLPAFVVVVTAFVSFLSFSLDCLEELFSSSFFLLLSQCLICSLNPFLTSSFGTYSHLSINHILFVAFFYFSLIKFCN